MGDITRADLAKDLADYGGISLRDADQYIDFLFQTIADRIAEGKSIELRGFGSFGSKKVKARQRRNFAAVPLIEDLLKEGKISASIAKDQLKKWIPAHKIAVFRPGAALKSAVRNGTEIDRPLRKNSCLRLSEWRKKEIAEHWAQMKEWGYTGFPEKVPDSETELKIAEKNIHLADFKRKTYPKTRRKSAENAVKLDKKEKMNENTKSLS